MACGNAGDEWYGKGVQDLPKPALSAQAWQQLEAQIRRLSRALQKRWQRAAQRIQTDLAYDIRSLQHELDKVINRRCEANIFKIPAVGEVYSDLLTLHDEFEEVTCQDGARTLSVRTSRIILDEIDLGSFEIELSWQSHDSLPEYRVIARSRIQPAKTTALRIPTSAMKVLCEGDARGAIRQLSSKVAFTTSSRSCIAYCRPMPLVGRLSSLMTGKEYRCSDCGCRVAESDSFVCYHCDAALCSDLSQLLQSVRRGPLRFVYEQLQRLSRGLLQQLPGDLSRLQTAVLPHLSRWRTLQCLP